MAQKIDMATACNLIIAFEESVKEADFIACFGKVEGLALWADFQKYYDCSVITYLKHAFKEDKKKFLAYLDKWCQEKGGKNV